MSDFHAWCRHYRYDPTSQEAARDYQEAQEALAALEGAADRQDGGRLFWVARPAQT